MATQRLPNRVIWARDDALIKSRQGRKTTRELLDLVRSDPEATAKAAELLDLWCDIHTTMADLKNALDHQPA